MSLLQRGETERKRADWLSITLFSQIKIIIIIIIFFLEQKLYFSCMFSLRAELGRKVVAGIDGFFSS